MLKATLLAAATAAVISVGALAGTTSAASAAPGYGWGGAPGGHPPYGYYPGPACAPVVRNVRWWDRFGFPHWKTIVVARSCGLPGPRPFPGHPYPVYPVPHW